MLSKMASGIILEEKNMADVKENVKQEALEIIADVKEEAQEVAQEAKAVVTGTQLDSANTVGGAGYREPEVKSKNGIAIASLVLGIVSIVCVFFGSGAVQWLTPVIRSIISMLYQVGASSSGSIPTIKNRSKINKIQL